jgi:hypothetical protein
MLTFSISSFSIIWAIGIGSSKGFGILFFMFRLDRKERIEEKMKMKIRGGFGSREFGLAGKVLKRLDRIEKKEKKKGSGDLRSSLN